MRQIFSNANNWIYYFAYAGGFASGNYIGMLIESKLAMGFYLVRIISKKDEMDMIQAIQNNTYGLTYLDAEGTAGKLKLIFVIVRRKNLLKLRKIIEDHDSDVFLSVEPIHSMEEGLQPSAMQPQHRVPHFAKKMK
jgi:uncharacterized protein YebE (UPF0316 family)